MFDIKNSADYYAMLVDDFDEFTEQPQSSRRAIHCAITASHLGEWIWHDWLKDRVDVKAQLGVTTKKSFYEYLKQHVWLNILREIANGSKHFERQAYKTEYVKGYGMGPYGVGPYGTGYLLVDLGDASDDEGANELALDEFGEPIEGNPQGGQTRYIPAAHLLEVVVRFWRDFFKTYRPDVPVAPSKHHVD
jgi:hypothetical protein